MSKLEVTSCDGCGQTAPNDSIDPFTGGQDWLGIYTPLGSDDLDACSWECMATIVAARIAAGADV